MRAASAILIASFIVFHFQDSHSKAHPRRQSRRPPQP